MIPERRLAELLSNRFRIPIRTSVYGSNEIKTTFNGGHANPEVVIEVPTQLIHNLSRKRSAIVEIADMVWRRWSEVRAEVFYDQATNRIGIRTPYNPEFITELKAFISPGARTWDGPTKTWYANTSYLDTVERLIHKYFPDATVTGPAAFEAPEDAEGDCYSRLLKPLPDHALKSVYRAIVSSCHPDKGKEYGIDPAKLTEIMTTVNVIWTEIKKARKWS